MRPQDLVAAGYDAIADRFGDWRARIQGSPDEKWLNDLFARLPEQADVLELGCGQGTTARRIVDAGHRYTGVDISAEQLRRARDLVPEAELRQADLTEIAFGAESLDAVVSLHVFNHLPRADLPDLLQRIADWLRPGGYFLATFGRSGAEGVEENWLGVSMFFASYTEDETRSLLQSAGFEIERAEVVTIDEPEYGEARFLWLVASARGRAARSAQAATSAGRSPRASWTTAPKRASISSPASASPRRILFRLIHS